MTIYNPDKNLNYRNLVACPWQRRLDRRRDKQSLPNAYDTRRTTMIFSGRLIFKEWDNCPAAKGSHCTINLVEDVRISNVTRPKNVYNIVSHA